MGDARGWATMKNYNEKNDFLAHTKRKLANYTWMRPLESRWKRNETFLAPFRRDN